MVILVLCVYIVRGTVRCIDISAHSATVTLAVTTSHPHSMTRAHDITPEQATTERAAAAKTMAKGHFGI